MLPYVKFAGKWYSSMLRLPMLVDKAFSTCTQCRKRADENEMLTSATNPDVALQELYAKR